MHERAPEKQHSVVERLLAALSYVTFPAHALQIVLLGFLGTVWNIGFIGYLVGGPGFVVGYLFVLVALGLIVQLAISVLVFRNPEALSDLRKVSFWKWRWIKDV